MDIAAISTQVHTNDFDDERRTKTQAFMTINIIILNPEANSATS